DAGVIPENIDVTNICTCCNADWLFSHRASKGLRGYLGAVIKLPE
ncbi:laccase domain-containing protein, partial [Coprococcus eutactus]